MVTQQAYILLPQSQSYPINLPFTVQQQPQQPQQSFRAPAHRHAHHLHSIPPREKSTRTLIIDHMLWVHGRTRFSQARAELGMTDRTGGPSSLNYLHRARPEGYEEDDEEGSEGEQVSALKARTGRDHLLHDDEERFRRQDMILARSLRLRAEGLEKVITSMLDQPPPVQPFTDDDLSNNHLKDLHRLPNGVRLRLALSTIINDLFARQVFHPPYRHTHHHHHHPPHPNPKSSNPSHLPDVLRPLAPISAAFAPLHYHTHLGPLSAFQEYQISQQPSTAQIPFQPFYTKSTIIPYLPCPSQRSKELYSSGSDPSTANCPPALRCPRHLHTACEICLDARSASSASSSSNRHRRASVAAGVSTGASSTGRGRSYQHRSGSLWKAAGPTGGITGWQEGTGIGSGLLRPSVRGSVLRRTVCEDYTSGVGVGGGGGDDEAVASGSGNTKLSKLIPRFLRLSALVAAELGREARGEEVESSSEDGRGGGGGGTTGSGGNTAVGVAGTGEGDVGVGVAVTVGVGASPSTPGLSAGGGDGGYTSLPSSPIITGDAGFLAGGGGGLHHNSNKTSYSPPTSSPSEARRRERLRMYEKALRPSREWYMLLAGLLTRAVLEGYLTAGWSGLQAVECLLLVGLGVNEGLYGTTRRKRKRKSRFRRRRKQEVRSLNSNPVMMMMTTSTMGGEEDGEGEEVDEAGGHVKADVEGREGNNKGYSYPYVGGGGEEQNEGENGNDRDDDDDNEYGYGDDEAQEDLAGDEEDYEDDDALLFAQFDPDELPDLMQAMKILFPSLRAGSFGVKDLAEEEYELQMLERLRRFYDVSLSTPDCSIHMEGLACQYPAEPVERAAVRFCEAIAKWRGKPELETYKKKPGSSGAGTTSSSPGGGGVGCTSSSPMTIESLVHSNPTSPNHGGGTTTTATTTSNGDTSGGSGRRPSIDVYFPRGSTGGGGGGGAGTGGGGGGGGARSATSQSPDMSSATTTQVHQHQQTAWMPLRENGNNNNKRYRQLDDVGRVDEGSKRMYAG